jgi:hypothetical protein
VRTKSSKVSPTIVLPMRPPAASRRSSISFYRRRTDLRSMESSSPWACMFGSIYRGRNEEPETEVGRRGGDERYHRYFDDSMASNATRCTTECSA